MKKTMENYKSSQKITFWKFLKTTKIEIPIIQRDYAQGRLGKEYLRKRFLSNLKEALDKKQELKLDFVYGSNEDGKFYPLDGQQRLTTLWLLHWYVALMSDNLNVDVCNVLKNFTYETRISSREFCTNLCDPKNFENYADYKAEGNRRIVDFITSRTWFYSAWKQDPTIQAMLRMLGGTQINDKNDKDIIDGLEELFPCPLCDIHKDGKCIMKRCWDTLTGNIDTCPIIFYHFPFQDYGLSDDLYIKMNARGKQLTAFENFKADLISYIRKQSQTEDADLETRNEWKELLDPKHGITNLMDTTWTDIFWNHKSKECSIDEIYFAFINRFFLNYLFDIENIQDENDSQYKFFMRDGYNEVENVISYDSFEKYKTIISIDFLKCLKEILNNYNDSRINEKESDDLKAHWNKGFFFISKYEDNEKVNKISTLNQKERIAFYAICKYFKEGPVEKKEGSDEKDYSSLNHWMRFVWNLISVETADGNDSIRSVSEMKNAINLINEINNSHNVYSVLYKKNSQDYYGSLLKEQFAEEIEKAKQIIDENGQSKPYNGNLDEFKGKTWEYVIREAEKYAFFKGSIRFLFQDANGQPNWDDFDTKWQNAKKFFDENGVKQDFRTNALLLRALLSRINIGENWFGNSKEFWLTSLLSNNYQSAVDYLLTTNELVIKDVCEQDWIKHEDLLKELLDRYDSWHILSNWRGFSVLTRYTQRRSDATSHKEIVVLNGLRNKLLNCDNVEIPSELRVGKTTYLYGWDINFKYKDLFFQWNGAQNEKAFVCLMEKGWEKRKERTNSTFDKGADEDTYYCFRVEDEMTSENFLKELDKLIEEQKNSSSAS